MARYIQQLRRGRKDDERNDWAENDDGVVSVYCIGQVPTNDYTLQVTVMEVAVDG